MNPLLVPDLPHGTTVGILALYLDHKVAVASKYGVHHRLYGLSVNGPLDLRTSDYRYYPEQVLPVLRPRSALTKMLPDGTIPLLEIAKLALNSNYPPVHRMYQLFEFKHARIPHPYPDAAYITLTIGGYWNTPSR